MEFARFQNRKIVIRKMRSWSFKEIQFDIGEGADRENIDDKHLLSLQITSHINEG